MVPRSVLILVLLMGVSLVAQTSRPGARRSSPAADDIRARALSPDWGRDAPGEKVVPYKMLPITQAPYSAPERMRHPIPGDSLVIGVEQGGRARAYPINMLGGPSREIINDQLRSDPFVVNW